MIFLIITFPTLKIYISNIPQVLKIYMSLTDITSGSNQLLNIQQVSRGVHIIENFKWNYLYAGLVAIYTINSYSNHLFWGLVNPTQWLPDQGNIWYIDVSKENALLVQGYSFKQDEQTSIKQLLNFSLTIYFQAQATFKLNLRSGIFIST